MQAIQLIALYTIYIDMIKQDRMTLEEALTNLAAAGLTTTDFDTWYGEDGKKFHFPLKLPFPSQDSFAVVLSIPLTTANIFPTIELLIKNQTKAMRNRGGCKFTVSPTTAKLLTEAQRLELNFKGVEAPEEGVMCYAGYDILKKKSLPDNTIILSCMGSDLTETKITVASHYSKKEALKFQNSRRR